MVYIKGMFLININVLFIVRFVIFMGSVKCFIGLFYVGCVNFIVFDFFKIYVLKYVNRIYSDCLGLFFIEIW